MKKTNKKKVSAELLTPVVLGTISPERDPSKKNPNLPALTEGGSGNSDDSKDWLG